MSANKSSKLAFDSVSAVSYRTAKIVTTIGTAMRQKRVFATARRTAQVDPLLPFLLGPMNGRIAAALP
jgi:hypothetical protein